MPSNVTITPAQSARNLGVIFDSILSMSDHISSFSKSCFLSIRDLRRIRNYTLDFSTARTIATSLIHSKLDYYNYLFLNLPQSQLGHLQLILNSSARAVSKTHKFAHISPVLKSLHWLKIEKPIQYKVASLTYKVLQSNILLISTAFSMFNLSVQLAPLSSSLSNVLLFAHVLKLLTGLSPTMLLYFGILYPNNCVTLRRHHHMALLLILLLYTCPVLASVPL